MSCGSNYREHVITKEYQKYAFDHFKRNGRPDLNGSPNKGDFVEYTIDLIRKEFNVSMSYDIAIFDEIHHENLAGTIFGDPIADVKICIQTSAQPNEPEADSGQISVAEISLSQSHISQTDAKPDPIVRQAAYTIRSYDDLLRYLWFNEFYKNNPSAPDFNTSEAEKQFWGLLANSLQSVEGDLRNFYANQSIPSDATRVTDFVTYGDPYQVDPGSDYMKSLSVPELIELYNEAYGVLSAIPVAIDYPEQFYTTQNYVDSYYLAQAFAAGDTSDIDPFSNYQSDLTLSDWQHERGLLGENIDLTKSDFFELATHLIADSASAYGNVYKSWFGDADLTKRDNVRAALLERLGENFTLDDLVNLSYQIAQQSESMYGRESFFAEETGTEIQNPHRDWISTRVEIINEEARSYYDAKALDELRQIVYDPSWNPEQEAQLLSDLDTAINQIVRDIADIDIGFVQDTFRAYHTSMQGAHDWRLRLKQSLDMAEIEMLERQNEEDPNPLWWLTEAVLGVLFEPLDWIFTARDLLQGDPTALIGFLPLIPSSARNVLKASSNVGGIAGETAQTIVKHLDNLEVVVKGEYLDYEEVLPLRFSDSAHKVDHYVNTPQIQYKYKSNPNLDSFSRELRVFDGGLRHRTTLDGFAPEPTGRKLINIKEYPHWLNLSDINKFEYDISVGRYGQWVDVPGHGKMILPVEFAAIYDSQGKLRYAWEGETYIEGDYFRFSTGRTMGSIFEGYTLTHFHPNSTSFSSTDINTFLRGRGTEIRTFGSTAVHRVRPDDSSLKRFESLYVPQRHALADQAIERFRMLGPIETNTVVIDSHQMWKTVFEKPFEINGIKIQFDYSKLDSPRKY